jgi:hypothetical protein
MQASCVLSTQCVCVCISSSLSLKSSVMAVLGCNGLRCVINIILSLPLSLPLSLSLSLSFSLSLVQRNMDSSTRHLYRRMLDAAVSFFFWLQLIQRLPSSDDSFYLQNIFLAVSVLMLIKLDNDICVISPQRMTLDS